MTTETFNPFEDEKPVEVTHEGELSEMLIGMQMPEGIVDRADEGDLTTEDVGFLMWMVDHHTNWSLSEVIESDGDDLRAAYLIDLVCSVVLGIEVTSWEEYKGDEDVETFMGQESLGINND